MRRTKRWVVGGMVLTLGSLLLAAPPRASALFQLAVSEDTGATIGAITVVASGASLAGLSFSGTNAAFPDYTFDAVSVLSASAVNGTNLSDLLSTSGRITATSPGHTVNVFVSSQDFTLPVGPTLAVRSGMSGTSEVSGGSATFRMWADANNGPLLIGSSLNTGTFSNGLQMASPALGAGVSFDTGGADPIGFFTRGSGNFSLIDRTTIPTTTVGAFNFVNHVFVQPVTVPEPNAGLIMLMVGVLGLFLGVRRRKS